MAATEVSTISLGVQARGSRRRPFIGVVAALALLVSLGAACNPDDPSPYFTDIPAATGDAPMRYRDVTFPSHTLTSNIPWSTAPDLEGNPVPLTLDLYEPDNDPATARPVLIVAHSGGFYTHTKTDHVSVDTAKYYAQRGYVVLSINYRLLAKVDCGSLHGLITHMSGCKTATLAAMSDAQAAVRWVRANAATYRMDPNRIAMSGDSAGAIMSILSGMLADVADNPTEPLSIETMAGAPLNESNPDHSSEIQAWNSISGGLPPTETPGLAEKLSESERKPAPGYLFAGTNDDQVPYDWTIATGDELRKVHMVVALTTFEDAGHVPWAQYKTIMLTQSSNFFYWMMDLENADQSTLD